MHAYVRAGMMSVGLQNHCCACVCNILLCYYHTIMQVMTF